MIKHVVMWRIKENAGGRSKKENISKLREVLEDLPGKIPIIQKLEVGVNFVESDRAADVMLYSEFNSVGDLDAYRVHPDHQKVVAFVKEIVSDSRAVDYEI